MPLEHRSARRKQAEGIVPVVDAISGRALGQLGNLSLGGLLLISTEPPVAEAVHQIQLRLPHASPGGLTLELGVQIQWQEPTSSPGQCWSGCRIISASDAALAQIEAWLG